MKVSVHLARYIGSSDAWSLDILDDSYRVIASIEISNEDIGSLFSTRTTPAVLRRGLAKELAK